MVAIHQVTQMDIALYNEGHSKAEINKTDWAIQALFQQHPENSSVDTLWSPDLNLVQQEWAVMNKYTTHSCHRSSHAKVIMSTLQVEEHLRSQQGRQPTTDLVTPNLYLEGCVPF